MSTVAVPELDDTSFEALVEEARSLIPRFAPEWTDHNLHDPGITVIDLLAFLVDQHIYRIGTIGPSLEAAFARLMGIETRPARPARFLVWPSCRSSPSTG
jgi:predicted phage baseplate assembly protein